MLEVNALAGLPDWRFQFQSISQTINCSAGFEFNSQQCCVMILSCELLNTVNPIRRSQQHRCIILSAVCLCCGNWTKQWERVTILRPMKKFLIFISGNLVD